MVENPRENTDKEEDYIGNIWGWKISYISLAVIVLLLSIMGLRYCTMDPGSRTQPEEIEIIK
jgi:hypothetical protein